ncbi:Uncharacterised protein [Klebsiella pneumoniae]|nr:Uncharacterised protein [Klebsiella pneumoniae]DAI71747.1 MAG TPA: hypothetical protein [Bacteriophage sp.]
MEDDSLFMVKEYAALLKLLSRLFIETQLSIICSVLAGHGAPVKKA